MSHWVHSQLQVIRPFLLPPLLQNGFWWSLGFCSLLFIPVIIFAVLASVFYLKSKQSEEDGDEGFA